jgi:hypothetical protein
MIDRREFMWGVAGLAAAKRANVERAPLTLELSVRSPASPRPHVRTRLEWADVAALTGVGARWLCREALPEPPVMALDLGKDEATLYWDDGAACPISLRNGCESFIAGWALPVVTHGPIGYDPGTDLPVLLSCGPGEYWRLPFRRRIQWPSALEHARSAYACFFGDWEPHSLFKLDSVAKQLDAQLDPSAHFIFNAVFAEQHEPAILLTAFGHSRK